MERWSRYEKSIEYTEKSLAISREIKDRPIELQGLISLGSAYKSLSRHEQAIEQFEKALAISRRLVIPTAKGPRSAVWAMPINR
ncbi:MAG: tetratricopeptide repeat protein [Acidobacteria bacterium]|nr:tetratricopeptide repeat protein [Acidobacteriota bacterium]